MTKSLSARLTAMFAACAAVVFMVGGLLLHSSLEQSLEQHVREELNLRATLIESMVSKVSSASVWSEKVAPKLDTIAQDSSGTLLWIVSDSKSFRYGEHPPGLARLAQTEGFGKLSMEGHHCDHATLVSVIPPYGERPALRLVVAKDPTPFTQTLNSFRIALVASVLVGVVLVTMLGYWIARVGLQPLRRLSRQAQALNPHQRAQRLGLDPLPAELSDLTVSFNGALERLERAYQQLEAFNADVAHELRTPLMNLIGQTQVTLTRPRQAAELEDMLHSNLEELERLRAIVNDMLFLARADKGIAARNSVEVSLCSEVGKVIEFLEPLMDEAGVRIRIAGDVHACIETALFRRAVTNLLQNAIQHSAAGDDIVVTIERRDGVSVSVSNRGVSIDEQQLTHLFDRFYRVDSSRHNSVENHGLGLAIVKAIATMHRGAVFVRSEAGWNTFGFTLASM